VKQPSFYRHARSLARYAAPIKSTSTQRRADGRKMISALRRLNRQQVADLRTILSDKNHGAQRVGLPDGRIAVTVLGAGKEARFVFNGSRSSAKITPRRDGQLVGFSYKTNRDLMRELGSFVKGGQINITQDAHRVMKGQTATAVEIETTYVGY
jgi:hypothetical protein